jgi:putative OPT family oligopeptide transporter
MSGMVICGLLISAGIFLLLDFKGMQAIIATLGIAGVVCCAACSANDMSQDYKNRIFNWSDTRKTQWMEIVGVLSASFILPPVLTLLHHAYGIGTGLKAPQATLFASIAKGFFETGGLPWNMVVYGIISGIVLVIIDLIIRKMHLSLKVSVMAIALGIYLPLSLSAPILIGGIVNLIVNKKNKIKKEQISDYGILLGSGLIAGESLVGVVWQY